MTSKAGIELGNEEVYGTVIVVTTCVDSKGAVKLRTATLVNEGKEETYVERDALGYVRLCHDNGRGKALSIPIEDEVLDGTMVMKDMKGLYNIFDGHLDTTEYTTYTTLMYGNVIEYAKEQHMVAVTAFLNKEFSLLMSNLDTLYLGGWADKQTGGEL